MPHFDEGGNYQPESGDFDNERPKQEGHLVMDINSIPGAKEYKPRDVYYIRIKVRQPEPSEEGGPSEIPVLRADAEEMDRGSKMHRERETANENY